MRAIAELWSSTYMRLSACRELESEAPVVLRKGTCGRARRWRYSGELLVPSAFVASMKAKAKSASGSCTPNSVIHHSASISLVGAAAALALAGAASAASASSNAAGDVAGALRDEDKRAKQACLAYVSAEKKGPVGYSSWFNLQF